MASFAERRRWSLETLEALGVHLVSRWVSSDNRERLRLRFPFLGPTGETLGYQDRAILDDDSGPKWLTGAGTSATFYNVTGLDRASEAIRTGHAGACLVVVEGVSDVVSLLSGYGLDYPVIGVPGAAGLGIPGEQTLSELAALFRAAAKGIPVLAVGDNDAAGRSFTARVAEIHDGPPVEILDIPARWGDLDEMLSGTDSEGWPL